MKVLEARVGRVISRRRGAIVVAHGVTPSNADVRTVPGAFDRSGCGFRDGGGKWVAGSGRAPQFIRS